MRTTSCNQCWYSPFTGGQHQFTSRTQPVWVGYQLCPTLMYHHVHDVGTMIGENGPLVTDEPVGWSSKLQEGYPTFRGIYRIHLKLIKKNRMISTCNRLELETLRSWAIMSKNPPWTLFGDYAKFWDHHDVGTLKSYVPSRCATLLIDPCKGLIFLNLM